ncbi:flagellar hook-length control protein FliK [Xanthobacter sediminis]
MTAPIDLSFATAATAASNATAAGHPDPAKAPAGGDKFGEIFSNLTHHSGGGASTDKDAKAGAKAHAKAEAGAEPEAEPKTEAKAEAKAEEKATGKAATARDAAAFGRLLQRWAGGEETATTDETADQKTTPKDGPPAQDDEATGQAAQRAADGRADQHAAAKARQTAETARTTSQAHRQDAGDAAEANLADQLADQLADPLADTAKGEATPPKASRPHGAETGQPAHAAREALAQAADKLADAIGTTRKAAGAGRQASGETGKADEAKHQDVADPQPSAAADAATTTAPAALLPSLAAAALLQQQAAAKDTKADAGAEHPASGGDRADSRSGSGVATGDGDGEVNHIQVKVTRRETHFAPVLDLNQRQAAVKAGAHDAMAQKSSAQDAAAREFTAAAKAAAKGEASAKTEAEASTEAASKTDTAESRQTAAGERTAAAPAASPGAGSGATSATGFGSLTSLPFATAAQVSRAITEEAARMQNGQPPGPQAIAQGPVRILEMTVTPESLGRVVIHMRLTANGLEVRVRAAEAGTAQMLAQDHDALVRIIERSGTKVDSLDIVKSISSPVEASVRPTWTASQSSGSSAEQDNPQRREQGRGGDNPGKRQADDDAQSRSRGSSDSFDG